MCVVERASSCAGTHVSAPFHHVCPSEANSTPICLMFAMAGRDVVLCSSDCVGSSAADVAIVASGAEFVVFRMAGRVHVAAGRDCAVEALLFAVFLAYCNAAAGGSLLHIFSLTICMNLDLFCSRFRFEYRRLPCANVGRRVEPEHAPAQAGWPLSPE